MTDAIDRVAKGSSDQAGSPSFCRGTEKQPGHDATAAARHLIRQEIVTTIQEQRPQNTALELIALRAVHGNVGLRRIGFL